MKLAERLKKIEGKLKAEDISTEIIFFNEGENLQDILRQKKIELKKRNDNLIFIKIIS